MPGAFPKSEELSDVFSALALKAGAEILRLRRNSVDVETKGDGSPVTVCDRRAEEIICEGLRETYADIPIVSEEAGVTSSPSDLADRFFLVDPLDGTKEFITGNPDFTINIAMIENGVPVVGCVLVPALGVLYVGYGNTAWKTSLQVTGEKALEDRFAKPEQINPILGTHPRILISHSHASKATIDWVNAFCSRKENADAELLRTGSSLKFCLIAEGSADIYPRFEPTMEWDTAAGDAVLRACGGQTCDMMGSPLTYGKSGKGGRRDFENPGFIASNRLIDLG